MRAYACGVRTCFEAFFLVVAVHVPARAVHASMSVFTSVSVLVVHIVIPCGLSHKHSSATITHDVYAELSKPSVIPTVDPPHEPQRSNVKEKIGFFTVVYEQQMHAAAKHYVDALTIKAPKLGVSVMSVIPQRTQPPPATPSHAPTPVTKTRDASPPPAATLARSPRPSPRAGNTYDNEHSFPHEKVSPPFIYICIFV